MFYTYILLSEKLDVFYTGSSQNLELRLQEHYRGKTAFAAKGMPWILIYSKGFRTRTEAMAFERKIKKRGAQRFLRDLNLQLA
ncbi:MAG: GIY-YIG nuclease family protein [Bacteroidales bacterium]|nr:MAG: GIY-YIG nuclease family protein [Bacteroidales bacterium]